MVAYEHEVSLHMIKQRPDLAVEILREVCRIHVPAYERIVPTSEDGYDAAYYLTDQEERKVFGVLLDMRPQDDPKKPFTWPTSLAAFRQRHECPVTLLVFCADGAEACRFDTEIVLGPRWVLRPVVFCPSRLPRSSTVRRPGNARSLQCSAHPPTPTGCSSARRS
jgi:hypothetical protein